MGWGGGEQGLWCAGCLLLLLEKWANLLLITMAIYLRRIGYNMVALVDR